MRVRAASRAATGALVGFRRADARRRKNFFTLFFFFFHHRLSVTKRKRIINCLREKPNERAPAPFCARFYGVPWRRRVCVALFSFFSFVVGRNPKTTCIEATDAKLGNPAARPAGMSSDRAIGHTGPAASNKEKKRGHGRKGR
ncbi:hypothetical protein TW95_gp0509 [Pandoravirus inopinatum]|uniref:Uncharacterized protein n=1 Tax=Pandoravirus inopinatum TaxID=1605721 RepID=A0A0B5IX04_9VIRU|nr:hypothetical protein TW95_gp0509 [Pandoravirus inopinatum]AJF97243.1 hypothetical protein [Pandoravirus inopinatum]